MKNLLVWILKDDRPGNYNQAINLADYLGFDYEIKEISYNKFAALPNFLKFGKFSTIDGKSKNNLLNQSKKPDILISAGRRLALIALDLKKIYPDLFLVHVMNPKINNNKFDVIISPKHDRMKAANVIEITGSIAKINEEKLEKNSKEFFDIFDKIESPKIGLLLGGSSKDKKFLPQDAKDLRKITDKICKNMGANLIVTSSRRTDQFIIDEIKKNNSNIKYFFEWRKDKANPYFAILQNSDYIIATGDSISMCCEICTLGKPVYIYSNENFCSKKHLELHENLFNGKFAVKLEDDLGKLSSKNLKKLDEMSKISEKIQKKIRKNCES